MVILMLERLAVNSKLDPFIPFIDPFTDFFITRLKN
jgi:hypothetical protein